MKIKPAVVEKFAGIDVAQATRDLYIDTGQQSPHAAYEDESLARIVACMRKLMTIITPC